MKRNLKYNADFLVYLPKELWFWRNFMQMFLIIFVTDVKPEYIVFCTFTF